MAQVKCDYCGSYIDSLEEQCPNCGAPNAAFKRFADGKRPETIEQLKSWYEARGLPPPETTRFFIGVDYKKPRAFGIYYDPNKKTYIVYKNKGNGSRVIRYEGTDEAYAVNEIYLKLKDEILHQKALNNGRRATYDYIGSRSKKKFSLVRIVLIVFVFIFIASFFSKISESSRRRSGYYYHDNNMYYYLDDYYNFKQNGIDNSGWYIFNGADWDFCCPPGEESMLGDDPWYSDESYKIYTDGAGIADDKSYVFPDNYQWKAFEDTSYYNDSYQAQQDYEAAEGYEDDWDDNGYDHEYDWDSNDSWDSGGGADFGGWDSDW